MFTSRVVLMCVAGRNDTQVAVIVYGEKSAVPVTWRDEQTEDNLLKLLETLQSKTDNKPRLGKYAVKTQQVQYSLTVQIYATLHTCGHSSSVSAGAALRLAVQTAVPPPPAGGGWASLKLWLWWWLTVNRLGGKRQQNEALTAGGRNCL